MQNNLFCIPKTFQIPTFVPIYHFTICRRSQLDFIPNKTISTKFSLSTSIKWTKNLTMLDISFWKTILFNFVMHFNTYRGLGCGDMALYYRCLCSLMKTCWLKKLNFYGAEIIWGGAGVICCGAFLRSPLSSGLILQSLLFCGTLFKWAFWCGAF